MLGFRLRFDVFLRSAVILLLYILYVYDIPGKGFKPIFGVSLSSKCSGIVDRYRVHGMVEVGAAHGQMANGILLL